MHLKNRWGCALVAFFIFLSASSYATHPDRRESHVLPSVSTAAERFTGKMSWGVTCYSFRTGIFLNCSIVHHTLFGVEESESNFIKSVACVIEPDGTISPDTCASGGHLHEPPGSPTRPRIRNESAAGAKLVYSGTDLDPNNKFNVSGDLVPNVWSKIEYETPDNAGIFYWQGRIAPPPCFFLPQYCGFVGPGAQDDGTVVWDGTIENSYTGLRQLPDMPNLYRKIRNGPGGVGTDRVHTDDVAFAGTARTLEAMRLIAEEYRTETGNLLRPNDLSLPLGGLFDITGRWRTSHYEHRFGTDIDFNRAPVVIAPNGSETTPDIDCEFDKDFVEAVNKVLAPFPNREVVVTLPNGTQQKFKTAVLCEKNLNNPILGRKHVDVTSIISKQQTP